MAKYTGYCTCYYDDIANEVVFYNELKDNEIERQKVENKEEAKRIMAEWVKNAPAHVICECLDNVN